MLTAEGVAMQLNSYEGDDWWGLLDALARSGEVDLAATRAANRDGELSSVVLVRRGRVDYDPEDGQWNPAVDADAP